jgi:hypothetical protein
MTLRYLTVERPSNSTTVPDLRSDILERHLPSLLESESVRTVLRSARPSQAIDEARKRTYEIAINDRIPDRYRSEMRQFAGLFAGQ